MDKWAGGLKIFVPQLRKLLFDLDRVAGGGEKVRRALAVLKSFIGGFAESFRQFQH